MSEKTTPLNLTFNFKSRFFEEFQINPNRKFKIKKYTQEELNNIINGNSEDELIKEYQRALKTMSNPSLHYTFNEDKYEFFSVFKIKILWDHYPKLYYPKVSSSTIKSFPNDFTITMKIHLYESAQDCIPVKDNRYFENLEELRLFEMNTDFDYISMQKKINLI